MNLERDKLCKLPKEVDDSSLLSAPRTGRSHDGRRVDVNHRQNACCLAAEYCACLFVYLSTIRYGDLAEDAPGTGLGAMS